jgi:hypothetical protein
MTTRPSLWHDLAFPVAVVACMAISSLAIWQFLLTARYGVYTTLASLIDRGSPVSQSAVTTYAAKAEELPATCRTDLLNAAITVAMRDIDQMRNLDDQAGWVASLRSLEPRLRAALGCVPTDGMLWERLAVVRWFLGGSAQEEAHLLILSQAYGPGELDVLQTRIAQWKRVSPAVIDLAGDALRSDIRTTLLYAKPASVAALLADMPAVLQPLVSNEAAAVPPDRRDLLTAAKIALP